MAWGSCPPLETMAFTTTCAASLLLAGAFIMTACHGSADDPAARVTMALRAANLGQVTAEYDAASATLRLKGRVASRGERDRALIVALDAVEMPVIVSNELTVRDAYPPNTKEKRAAE
jgi:hypothetical protein